MIQKSAKIYTKELHNNAQLQIQIQVKFVLTLLKVQLTT